MVFSINFSGDPHEIILKIQEEAHKQGILFEGTTNSGRFEGRGIEGIYWLASPQEFKIQINKKPIVISEDKIRQEIQKYVDGL